MFAKSYKIIVSEYYSIFIKMRAALLYNKADNISFMQTKLKLIAQSLY